LDVYSPILQHVQLSNGIWQAMQQDHAPWKGAWIFMTQRGDLYVEVDGLVSRAVIENFAASLR